MTTNPSARVKAGTYRFTVDALAALLEWHTDEITHWDAQIVSCKHGAPDTMTALSLTLERETDEVLRSSWILRQMVHCHRMLTRLACMREDVEAIDIAVWNAKERHAQTLQYEEYISMAMHWFLDTIKRYKDMVRYSYLHSHIFSLCFRFRSSQRIHYCSIWEYTACNMN